MPLLIDGFNLMYKFPELEQKMYLSHLNDARDGLLVILKEYQKIKKSTIRVVFDGKKNPSINLKREKSGTIDIYYSLEYSADYLIKQFIKKDLNPKMTTVITSDKEIIFYVKRFGAKVMESEKFSELVNKTISQYRGELDLKKELKDKENPDISYWQKVFSGGREKRKR